MSCGLRAGRQVWGEEHDEDRALSATSEQVEQDEGDRGGSVCAEALDAHRQVLEMAATIELLSKNFELMQRELSAAYARLEEYASNSPVGRESMNSTRPRPRLQGSPRHTECCTHQHEVDELRKVSMFCVLANELLLVLTKWTLVVVGGSQGLRAEGGPRAA